MLLVFQIASWYFSTICSIGNTRWQLSPTHIFHSPVQFAAAALFSLFTLCIQNTIVVNRELIISSMLSILEHLHKHWHWSSAFVTRSNVKVVGNYHRLYHWHCDQKGVDNCAMS